MTSSNPAEWAGYEAPPGKLLGWKVVRPDGRTYGDFQWPFHGDVKAHAWMFSRGYACPSFPGDGLCIAKTWSGAASGGYAAITGLAIVYDESDVLGSDPDKVRVSQCSVIGVLDLQRLIREGHAKEASLSRANLYGANLSGANLYGADLSGANLYGANLSGADLSGADLSGANLYGANLSGANLSGADLSRADFSRADLYGAVGYTPAA